MSNDDTCYIRSALPRPLYDRLGHHAIDQRTSRTALITQAIKAYVERLDDKTDAEPSLTSELESLIPADVRGSDGVPGIRVEPPPYVDPQTGHLVIALLDRHADGTGTGKALGYPVGAEIASVVRQMVERRAKRASKKGGA